jgi:hypothetical protein
MLGRFEKLITGEDGFDSKPSAGAYEYMVKQFNRRPVFR